MPGAADTVDFEALENRLRQRALELAARAVERRWNEDHSDHCGPQRPCPCGQTAHYAGRRAKTCTTVLGRLTLQRAYYHCPACHHGCFPRDAALGLARTDLSPGVTRMTGTAAALVSFAQASALLDELAGVQVGCKHVQRTAEALGRELAAVEQQAAQDSVAPPDAEGRPVRDPGSASYSAAIESAASRDTDAEPSPFAQRMRREAERRVILGDGAQCIWRIAGEDYPGALQIVDLWHAKKKLWDVAKALYGSAKAQHQPWADARCDDLEQGRIDPLLATLRTHADRCQEAAQCADYIAKNRSRMRYPEFRQQGLCVGSGVVESGCRSVVGRLKRSGMYWTVANANAILALRCCLLSGRYEDFWANRADNSRPQPPIQT